jgi:hypothetical protein
MTRNCSLQAASLRSMSSQYSDIRKQLESDEQLKILMAGLRGSNLNDSDYAEEGVTMSLVEVCMQNNSPGHGHDHFLCTCTCRCP